MERPHAPDPARGAPRATQDVYHLRPARPAASQEVLGVSAGSGEARAMKAIGAVALVLWVFVVIWLTRPGPGDYQWD